MQGYYIGMIAYHLVGVGSGKCALETQRAFNCFYLYLGFPSDPAKSLLHPVKHLFLSLITIHKSVSFACML